MLLFARIPYISLFYPAKYTVLYQNLQKKHTKKKLNLNYDGKSVCNLKFKQNCIILNLVKNRDFLLNVYKNSPKYWNGNLLLFLGKVQSANKQNRQAVPHRNVLDFVVFVAWDFWGLFQGAWWLWQKFLPEKSTSKFLSLIHQNAPNKKLPWFQKKKKLCILLPLFIFWIKIIVAASRNRRF